MNKRLYRDEQHKTIGGVCAGLAEYLNIDVSIVRVLFLLSFVLKGVGLVLYIVMWIVLPKRPYGLANPGVDYVVNPESGTEYAAPSRVATSGGKSIWGMVLVLIGLLLLLNEFDIIPDFDFEYFWPSLLIIVGLVFIFTSRNKATVANTNDPFDQHPPKL